MKSYCLAAGIFAVMLLSSQSSIAAVQFEDVSEAAGFTGHTESWGLSWGDVNNDNCPDLFIQGHRFRYPRFYRNTCDGAFQDVAYEYDPDSLWLNEIWTNSQDRHAAAWADFDNDGDQDILIAVSASGTGRAQLLVNQLESGGKFVERAVQADLSYDSSARQATWLDFDGDGYLDVIQQAISSEFLRRQDPAQGLDFDDVRYTGFTCRGRGDYGQLADLNNDGTLDYICGVEGTFPSAIWDYSDYKAGTSYSFTDISSMIQTIGAVNDTVVADINNDLRTDMILSRGTMRFSGAAQTGPNTAEAWMRKSGGTSTKRFSFVATGQVTFVLDHDDIPNQGPSDVRVLDTAGTTSATSGPMAIAYDEALGRWDVTFASTSTEQVYVRVTAVNPISDVTVANLDQPEAPLPTYVAMNDGTSLNYVYNSGLSVPMECVSAVAADFDNDMDLDLFFACGGGARNLPNRYFDNRGDGTFVEITNHGGEGPVGPGVKYGVSESVAAADYDVDGFVDLAVVNGLYYYPVGIGGPDTLLHNQGGNGNHWIELNLIGDPSAGSNRSAIGARVVAIAGGISQLREQNGGTHRFSQNMQRIHFGLAGNTAVEIQVTWPSGASETYQIDSVDQLYDLQEGVGLSVAQVGPPVRTQLALGEECGQPPYNQDYGPAMLLWKDCTTDLWQARFEGGRETQQPNNMTGTVIGNAPFANVAGTGLNGGDSLANDPASRIDYSMNVWFTNDKGFSFDASAQSQSCMSLDNQDIDTIIVGASKKRVSLPLDLVSLGECVDVPPPPSDDECGEPGFDAGSERGLFIWKDCDFVGPAARWNVRVTAGGGAFDRYTGELTASTDIAATGFSLEGNDALDTAVGDNLVDWRLGVGSAGVDGFQVDIPAGTQTCFTPEDLPGAAQVQLGMNRQVINGPFDLATLQACLPPEPPPQDVACGQPQYDRTTEQGLYVWKDCSGSGPSSVWTVRAVGGGASWAEYAGTLTSDTTLAASTYSLEGQDVVDSAPGDGVIDYSMFVGGTGEDGFSTTIPDSAQTCFDSSMLPPGATVMVGENETHVSGPFNLQDLGACN